MNHDITGDTSHSTAVASDVSGLSLRNGPLTILMLLTGVWLFVGYWLLGYPVELRTPHLIETGASIIVIITAIARLSRPRGAGTDLLLMVIGAGLVLAAFLADYYGKVPSDAARINQAASGSLLLLLAMASAVLLARSQRRTPGSPPVRRRHR